MKGKMRLISRIFASVLLVMLSVLAAGAPVPAQTSESDTEDPTVTSEAALTQAQFHDAMRKLWEDHIIWTRLVMISVFSDLPDLQATQDRLLQNQADIGDAIKPFYGEAAGTQLTDLLRQHILLAADLLVAANDADSSAMDTANTAWYANASDIAAFLNNANPDNWTLSDAQSMMEEHLDLTLAEAVARLTAVQSGTDADFEADIAAYDKVHEQILVMADMLSDGIIAQFPEKFAAEEAAVPSEAQANENGVDAMQTETATIDISAQDMAFDQETVTVPAGAKVTVNFNNNDAGIPHNFAVYTDSTADTSIFVGEIITGPDSVTYEFTAPSEPGEYFFRCDVHPTTMTGTFQVTS